MRTTALLALTTALLLPAACRSSRDQSVSTSGESASVSIPATPMATVERIRSLRNDGRYHELRAFVPPQEVATTIDFLMAMDEVISANAGVQAAVRRHAPASVAELDLSVLRNLQGVFSADVKVVDERVDGKNAWVSIEVGGQLPLEQVRLTREDTRWVYHPDASLKGFPESLQRLAASLRRVAKIIEAGSKQPNDIRDAYRVCVSPHVKNVQQLAAAQTSE